MKNRYEVIGDKVIIYLNRDLTTTIDLDDLEKVDSHPGTWGAYPGGRGSFYVHTKIPGTRQHMKLARFIMDATKDEIIDHESRDTLDNTRGNLRSSDRQKNRYNSNISSNNTSGHTGVVSTREGTWRAQIYKEGKSINLGTFIDKEDAIRARLEAEKEIFI